MKVVIDLELSERQKKVIRSAAVLGAVIGALGLGLAVAAPHQWASNDTLQAADLNSLNVLSVAGPDGGTVRYSVGATKVCGVTSGNYTGGQVNGYSGAKAVCEQTCGSPTAHMCMAEEIGRTRAVGGTVLASGDAWYSTVIYSQATAPNQDCIGWTSASAGVVGNGWHAAAGNGGGPWDYLCNASQPILCCD